jgi:hypothetical protein
MTDEPIRICIDRILPEEYQPARARATQALTDLLRDGTIDASNAIGRAAIALVTLKKWPNGSRLRCRFLDGDDYQKAKVEEKAKLWEEYADVTLDFGDDPDAEIRISFQADPGSWSAVGTDALIDRYFPKYQPTMNFGWLRDDTDDEEYERVVVHEFGHALGCIHEHQSPAADLQWDKPKVYKLFMGPPNFWTKNEIDFNIFDKYSSMQTQFTEFDPKSIMLYAFPAALFLNHVGTDNNTRLSDVDKQFIGTIYPKH